jgi:putative heme-binding domain-containing protein
LLRRGGEDLASAVKRLDSQPGAETASINLPWLLAAGNSQRGFGRLAELSRSERAPQRRQALAAWAESATGATACAAAIGDAAPQIQLIALGALIDGSGEFPLDDVLRLACSEDLYLRQTACKALAARATLAQLETLSDSNNAAERLAAVLALALQLTVPATHDEPPQELPLFVPGENSFFKTRLAFVGGAQPVELASLGRIGSYTTAERWAKTPHHPDDQRRATLLARALEDPAERVQLQAAYSLGLLRDPQYEPLIERTRRQIAVRRFDGAAQQPVDRIWVLGPLPSQAEFKPRPEQQAIDLSTRHETSAGPRNWQILTADSGDLPIAGPEVADFYGYFTVQSSSRQPALITTDWPGALGLWQNGNAVPGHVNNETKSTQFLVDLQPGGNDLLIKLSSPASSSGNRLAVRLCTLAAATIALPEKLDSAELAKRLSDAAGNRAGQSIPPELLAVDWPVAVKQGNVDSGRRLFGTLGCVKCHAVAADQQGGGGPSLHQAARRLTIPYLVESILLPGKQVAEPFRATRVVTADGLVLIGLVTAETANEIELLLADTSRRKIAIAEIDERSISDVSPMPQGLVKTPQELGDLLAYLLSDRPMPP